MKTMSCDIIQDLLPSYVDGICSDATKECVKDHMLECDQCKKLVEIYRDTEISDCSIEQKQIDGFKKFHRQLKLMNLFSIALVLLLTGLGTYTFCINYIILSTIIYYVLFPICMVGLYLFTTKKGHMKCAEKKDYLVAALSLLDTFCAIGFLLYSINCIMNGKLVFSVENEQLGPFINMVWGILFFLLVVGIVYLLLRMIRNNIKNQSIICLLMMGMFLLLAYVTLLKDLTSIDSFYSLFTQVTLIIGAMGLAGSIVFAVIGKR
jgi:hypothetical protein